MIEFNLEDREGKVWINPIYVCSLVVSKNGSYISLTNKETYWLDDSVAEVIRKLKLNDN